MKKVIFIILLLVSVGALLYLYGSEQGSVGDVTNEAIKKDEFKMIAQQIEDNSADSYGQTKEGLEKGLLQLEKLYRDGDDSFKVRMLLARTYRVYGLKYFSDNLNEKNKYYAKSKEMYEALINNYPENVDILSDYVGLIHDAETRISVYKKILTIDPKNVRTHKIMSTYYDERGDTKKALEAMRKAFVHADGNDIYDLGIDLSEWLEILGRHEEAEKIRLEQDERIQQIIKRIVEKEKGL